MKLISSELYGVSPIYLQNMLLSFLEYCNSRKRYGMGYYRFLHQLAAMDETDRQSEQQYQNQELRSIVRHAAQHSPFYQQLYGEELVDIQSVEDLHQLPAVDEERFIGRISEVYTTQRKNSASMEDREPQTAALLRLTDLDLQRQAAIIDFFKKQHGAVNLEMKRATFSNSDFIPETQKDGAFWRDVYYLNFRLYSARHCIEPFLESMVRNLNNFRPDFIDGMPSAILALSRYINSQHIVLDFQTVAVFAETAVLTDSERLEIENAFGCTVRRWSMEEYSPFLYECKAGNLHFDMRTGVLEFGENGTALLTRFHTKGTPMIRLKIKTSLVPVHCPCPCGSVHPLVQKPVEGESAFLQSKSRGKVTSLYLSTIREKFRKFVPSMQFVQNSFDAIDIWIDGAAHMPVELKEKIIQEMMAVFGADMRFTIRNQEQQMKDKEKLIINNLPLPKNTHHNGCGTD